MAYRGAMLYGDSGAGKSSLVNAGLIPQVLTLGLSPERLRVQPRPGEEIVLERVALGEGREGLLPSLLAPSETAPRAVLSVEAFERSVRTACATGRPLLVLDQFEEMVTLFEQAHAGELQGRVLEMLTGLMRQSLPVKLLFVFREDYLGRLKELLAPCPELVDQALRLSPPTQDTLTTIIRGPFEAHPGHFPHELSTELASDLRNALGERFGSGEVSLSEVQTVCLRLWQAQDPHRMLAERGVQGLLEDYLGEALDAFPVDVRAAAIALLSEMVTTAGTRNVVTADYLFERVRDEQDLSPELLATALERLERESKLVRRERRRDLDLYEITSEFLVPWISRQREDLRRQQERRRERRRLRIAGLIGLAGVLLAVVIGTLAIWAFAQRSDAKREATAATSLVLSSAAQGQLEDRLDVSLLLSLAAYKTRPLPDAQSAMAAALEMVRRTGTLGILRGHTNSVRQIVYSHGGSALLSTGTDGTLRFWNLATNTQVGAPLQIGKGQFSPDVAFSPGGGMLAVGSYEGTVRLWDTAKRRAIGRLRIDEPGADVQSLAFSADGNTLAVATGSGLELWDVHSMEEVATLKMAHDESVNNLAFSQDGQFIAAAGYVNSSADRDPYGTVRLWRTAEHGSAGRLLESHVSSVTSVVFNPTGTMLAAGGYDERITLWNPVSGARIGAQMHAGDVTSLAFSPNGHTLAAGGFYGDVELWNPADQKYESQLATGHQSEINSVVFSPDGKDLAAGDEDTTIRLWNLASAQRALVLNGSREIRANLLAFSPDGRDIAVAGSDDEPSQLSGSLLLWELGGPVPRGEVLASHMSYLSSFAFSPDGSTVAVNENGAIRLWNVKQHSWSGELVSATAGYNSVVFSPDGKTVAASGYSGGIDLWNSYSQRLLAELPQHGAFEATTMAFSPDGRTLVLAGGSGQIQLWDVDKRRISAEFEAGRASIETIAFSPDGRLFATGGEDGAIRFWNSSTHDPVGSPLVADASEINSIAFSPDGKLLAAGGADGDTRLWDVAGRRQLGQPLGAGSGDTSSVGFSPDGETLATVSSGSLYLWSGFAWKGLKQLQKQVCAIAGQGLSESEWGRYAPDVPYQAECG
jgi:WD40 repeat protein